MFRKRWKLSVLPQSMFILLCYSKQLRIVYFCVENHFQAHCQIDVTRTAASRNVLYF